MQKLLRNIEPQEKSASGKSGQTSCQQCTSTYQTLHEAAHSISPSDITSLLSSLYTARIALFADEYFTGEDGLFGGIANDRPHMA